MTYTSYFYLNIVSSGWRPSIVEALFRDKKKIARADVDKKKKMHPHVLYMIRVDIYILIKPNPLFSYYQIGMTLWVVRLCTTKFPVYNSFG